MYFSMTSFSSSSPPRAPAGHTINDDRDVLTAATVVAVEWNVIERDGNKSRKNDSQFCSIFISSQRVS